MNDITFEVFRNIESGLQSLIDDGLTNKEEIIKLLDEGLNNFDWYQLGIDTANGDKGSGWMAIGKDIGDYRALDHDGMVEEVDGWTETDAWNHEVFTLIKKYCGEENYDAQMSAKDDWVEGYLSAVIDRVDILNKVEGITGKTGSE
jgi:hypothetical protein